ncbi:hypothetical protein C8R42DRAFT_598482 [Lentinula raphanica]|nr:hypothetical protein C8R42DRAFT_598482 [Lentinula raphanica]
MEHARGSGRGSYIWGRSVHNVRIERLWVDVSNYITQPWNDIFSGLEQRYHLDISNPNHIWLLQYLFMDTINIILAFWAEGWNNHRITQRDGPSRSPEDMWGFDMLVHGIRGDSVDDFSMSDQELADFGVDWEDLEDEALLQSLRRNYAHEEGASTWLGRHGPPPVLNEVHVEPPSGLMTTAEIQALDSFLEPISQFSNEGDVIRLWCMALAYVRALYPDYFLVYLSCHLSRSIDVIVDEIFKQTRSSSSISTTISSHLPSMFLSSKSLRFFDRFSVGLFYVCLE